MSGSRAETTPTCCEPTGPPPVPVVTLTDGTRVPSGDSVAAHLANVFVSATDSSPTSSPEDVRGLSPPGVSLYTLHATFLI